MSGKWIEVPCISPECTNYGGYWSNTGRPKADKKQFLCEKHGLS